MCAVETCVRVYWLACVVGQGNLAAESSELFAFRAAVLSLGSAQVTPGLVAVTLIWAPCCLVTHSS